MFKKITLTIFFFLPAVAFIATKMPQSKQWSGFESVSYGQEPPPNSLPTNDIISAYKHLSMRQLIDTARHYYLTNSNDTALICYSLIINTPVKDTDIEGQERIIVALNESGIIYRRVCDYRKSYELLIKALDLCEKYQYDQHISKIYANVGNIYYRLNKYDIAKSYYLKALNLCENSVDSLIMLNNLGAAELEGGKTDSVFDFLNRSLQISKRNNDIHSEAILNSIALFYQKTKQYDSAFYYFRLSLNDTRKNHKVEYEVENLSGLGKLFFEVNKTDSALYYINLSNTIAAENNFLRILAENHFSLSQIEESKGRKINAFEHFKTYANLKDSIFDVDKFGEINQLQRLYEVSKINQQIEQLAIEQRIKERTIRYQKIILFITLGVLLLVSGALLVVFFQKKKLNTAYKTLFEKNIKIIDLQESSPEKHPEKYKKSALTDDKQEELLDRILLLMEDTAVIYDTEFSLDRLAELIHSNHAYVSQVINNALKKNFRSFLNSYRIREAQRLFSEPDAAKYTVESVALRVGFKSRSTFSDTFKEITGVSPNFYLKAMQKQQHLS